MICIFLPLPIGTRNMCAKYPTKHRPPWYSLILPTTISGDWVAGMHQFYVSGAYSLDILWPAEALPMTYKLWFLRFDVFVLCNFKILASVVIDFKVFWYASIMPGISQCQWKPISISQMFAQLPHDACRKKQWIFGRQCSGIILNFNELHLFSKNCLVTPPWQDKHDLSRCKAGNRQLHGNCGHLLRWRKDQWRGSWNDDCRSCHTQPGCTVRTSIKVLKTEVLDGFRKVQNVCMLCNDLSCTFVDDSSMIITLYRYTFINAAFECIWFREKLQTNSGRVGVAKVFAGSWSSGCHQISCSLGEDPGFMSTPLVITFLLPDGRSTHLVSGIFHFQGTQHSTNFKGDEQYGSFFWSHIPGVY